MTDANIQKVIDNMQALLDSLPNKERTVLHLSHIARWIEQLKNTRVAAGVGPTNDVWEAFKSWPDDIRRKLSCHDLRRMNGWAPKTSPDDWEIDTSTGRPILTYKKCSVIEAEDARYVLSLIRRDSEHPAPAGEVGPERCPKCGYTADDCAKHMDHHLCGNPTPGGAGGVTDEQVERACAAFNEYWGSLSPGGKVLQMKSMRKALEAAAPQAGG